MTSRTRLWVLAISTPVIVFALVGGYLGQAMAKDDTYQHLRVFDDVVTHVVNNYVEEVDLKQAMRGAMRGLAEALDADSAFLTPELVRTVESNTSAGPGDVGIELVRQYYLRVVSAREGSPPPRPACAPAISSARSTTGRRATCPSYEGARLLRGALGIKGRAARLPRQCRRSARDRRWCASERRARADVADGQSHHRIRPHRRLHQGVAGADQAGVRRAGQVRRHALHGRSAGARPAAIWTTALRRRGCSSGAARSPSSRPRPGVTWSRRSRRRRHHGAGGLLVDQGTAAAAEVFASALAGNDRAELVGERTLGRAARQQLVKLPDGSGLLLSSAATSPRRTKASTSAARTRRRSRSARRRVRRDAAAKDETLDKALERLAEKKAA